MTAVRNMHLSFQSDTINLGVHVMLNKDKANLHMWDVEHGMLFCDSVTTVLHMVIRNISN